MGENWKKASKKISRLQRKVANQRVDWTHRVAAQIVSGNSLVATIDSGILFFVKSQNPINCIIAGRAIFAEHLAAIPWFNEVTRGSRSAEGRS
jgi:hypothetical protein